MTHFRRRLAGDAPEEGGFTLVELMVTMVIISVVLLGLVGLQVSALVTTTEAKQRQQATAMANEVLEQLRSLPYQLLSRGLNSAGLAGDPNISSGVLTLPGISEPVIADNTGQDAPPLAALTPTGSPTYNQVTYTDTGSSSVTFTARSYVSRAAAASTSSPFNLSVVVTWTSSASRGAAKRLIFRSTAFAPTGCLSTATRPFSGPCQAFLYADAAAQAGAITISRSDAGDLVGAEDVTALTLAFLSGSVGIDAEQTTGLNGRAVTGGAARSNGATVVARSGQVDFRTLAGDDPASVATAPVTDTDSVVQSASPLQVDGDEAVLTATPAATESGTLISTASSPGSCTDIAGLAMTGNPCGNTTVRQTATASLDVDYKTAGGRNLPAFTLASSAAPATASTSWAARYVTTPGTTRCTTLAGAGCIAAGTKRTLGTVQIGALPAGSGSDGVPGMPTGMVQLTNYTDQVYNESGATSNSVVQGLSRAGTLKYTGQVSGVQSVALTKDTSISEALSPISGTYTTSGVPLVVSITGNVTVSPAVVTSDVPDAQCTTGCVKKASMSTVVVTLTYTLSQGGFLIDTFDVKVDLGSSYAATTYKAAPSA